MTAAVGLDVGGTFMKGVRLGEDGSIEARIHRPTPTSWEGIFDTLADSADTLGRDLPVGVGVAGLVDHEAGSLVWAPHLPGEEVRVRDSLADRLGRKVFVDNDANCAAVGEHRHGAARGYGDVMMVTLGTGIGMGLLIGGEVHRGRHHAGEVGHMTVDPGGDECACGRRGCWETRVSGRRLGLRAVSVLGEGRRAADLAEAAGRGDRQAASVLAEAGHWLGWGIESLVLALDPEVVVVGGAAVTDMLLAPVEERLARTEGAGRRAATPVRAGILGPDSGAVGAAVCVGEEKP